MIFNWFFRRSCNPVSLARVQARFVRVRVRWSGLAGVQVRRCQGSPVSGFAWFGFAGSRFVGLGSPVSAFAGVRVRRCPGSPGPGFAGLGSTVAGFAGVWVRVTVSGISVRASPVSPSSLFRLRLFQFATAPLGPVRNIREKGSSEISCSGKTGLANPVSGRPCL